MSDFTSWNPVEVDSQVTQAIAAASAVNTYGRSVKMTSLTKLAPRFVGGDVASVAKATDPGDADMLADSVTLTLHKVLTNYPVAEEDIEDSFNDVAPEVGKSWGGKWAKWFDNATLAVTAGPSGETVPYLSLYKYIRSDDTDLGYTANSNYTASATAGGVTFDDLNKTYGIYQASDYADDANSLCIIHPTLLTAIRGLKDDNHRPISDTVLVEGDSPSLFGVRLVKSRGARTSATATSSPTGHPLLIFVNSLVLARGDIGDGLAEARVIPASISRSDTNVLQFRLRKGFHPTAPGAAILEALS